MRARSVVVGLMILAAVLAVGSLNAAAAVNSPQETSTLSFTVTTTSSYIVGTGGPLIVNFNSVQLDTSSPQAYAFGIIAITAPWLQITRLHWDFGDGIFMDVPYCCQSRVSEVRYHAYQQPGSYIVTIIAYDSGGDSGVAATNISWPTPVPEFQTIAMPLLASIFMVVATGAILKTNRRAKPLRQHA